MKVAFVMPAKLNTGRGTENVVFSLIKYKPKDIKIVIFEPNFLDGERIKDTEVRNLIDDSKRVQMGITLKKHNDIIDFLVDRMISKSLLKELKNCDLSEINKFLPEIDLIYFFSNSLSIFFQRTNIPLIGSNHTDNLKLIFKHRFFLRNIYDDYFYRLYYKNLTGIHFFPKTGNNLYKMRYPSLLRDSFVLSIGVDTTFFYPMSKSRKEKIKVLFVAALDRNKGINTFIKLARNLSKKLNIEFHVAGKGRFANIIKAEKTIFFHQDLDNNQLSELYRSCDIFLYPTKNDNFPAVVLQALSSGLYVMTSDYLRGVFDDFEGDYLEYIKPRYSCFKSQLIRTIHTRLNEKYSKTELYEKVKSEYDWSVISNRFFEKIKNIAENYN
jgi:glycosyltransferase involved in cell wall biosynthesis